MARKKKKVLISDEPEAPESEAASNPVIIEDAPIEAIEVKEDDKKSNVGAARLPIRYAKFQGEK